MEQEFKITIAVPCYNESKRLPIDDFNNFLELNEKVDFFC